MQQNNAVLEGNTFISNSASYGGGALAAVFDTSLLSSGNVIRANDAYVGGGLYLYDSEARLINNVIADNSASGQGSGLYATSGAAPQLWHNTVAHNTGGTGIYLSGSTATLVNTILVGHTTGINAASGSTAIMTATLWGSGAWANSTDWSGSASIGLVTLHSIPASDRRRRVTIISINLSAAINQGVEAGITTDIDQQARPNGSAPDLGADEWYKLINQAPLAPTNPSPVNGALNVWVGQALTWQGGDPDGDPITYTIALSPSNPPAVVGQSNVALFTPGQLLTTTHYYWKVTATDGVSTTVGPLWEFTTRNEATIYRVYLPLVRK